MGSTFVGQLGELALRPSLTILAILCIDKLDQSIYVDVQNGVLALLLAGFTVAIFCAGSFYIKVYKKILVKASFEIRSWIVGSIRNSVATLLITSSYPLSFLFIESYLGDAELGIFRVSYQLSIAAAIGLLAAKVVVAPKMAKSISFKKYGEMKYIFARSIITSVLFSAPIALLLILYPNEVIDLLFGTEYVKGATTLKIITVGILINSIFGPIDVYLQVAKRDRYLMWSAVTRALILVGLIMLLVPMLGIEGAAYAFSISTTIWCFVLLCGSLNVGSGMGPPPAP